MRLLTPVVPDPGAPLARANPVAKLVAALPVLVALFVSLDGVTAATVLLALAVLLPISGISGSALIGRLWPLVILAVAIGAFNVLFAAEHLGRPVLSIGPLRIGDETLLNGGGLALRLVAIVLLGVLATATSNPTELADALVQQGRASPRFAIGVLAALRLAPLLSREWEVIGLARRARGVDADGSPIAALRLFAGQIVALLVGAIRRGSRMAVAMEARGFGSKPCRTVARPQRMGPADWAWVVGGLALGCGSVALSIWLGTWRPLL